MHSNPCNGNAHANIDVRYVDIDTQAVSSPAQSAVTCERLEFARIEPQVM